MDCRDNYTTLWLYQKTLGCTLLKNDDDDDDDDEDDGGR